MVLRVHESESRLSYSGLPTGNKIVSRMARPRNIHLPARGTATQSGSAGTAGTESSQVLQGTANTGSPLKNALAKMAAVADYLVGRDRGAQKEGNYTDEESSDGLNNAVEEPVHEEEEVAYPSAPNLRKRPAPRDIYQLPPSPGDQEQAVRTENPRKRAKTTVKAKKAIVPPKRSLRNNTGALAQPVRPLPARRTESARNTRSNNLITSTPASSPHRAISGDAPQLFAKRPRGRPRKNPSAPPTSTATKTASIQVTNRNKGRLPVIYGAPDGNGGEEEEQEQPVEEEGGEEGRARREESEDDGISAILLNPSPVKPVPLKIFRQEKTLALEAGGRDADIDAENEESEIPENGDPKEGELDDDSEELLIEEGVFDKMIDIADRVGYHHNKESRSWTSMSSPNVSSTNGKRFMRRAEVILQSYRTLQRSLRTGNLEAVEKTEEKVAELVEQLHGECHTILSKRLGNPTLGIDFLTEKTTTAMLQDIYFHINPSLVKILKTASDVYPPKRSMEQTPLRHLYLLITMLADLANTALIQPKDYQPIQRSKSQTWNVSKPTSLLKPYIESIKKAVSKEFAGRELAQKAIENDRLRRKWTKRTEEQERRKDSENRRRRKEIRRKQREAYEQLVSQPYMSRLLNSKPEARNGHAPVQEPYSVDHVESNDGPQDIDYDQDLPIEDDPFAEEGEDDEGPRLSLFGTNNTNNSTHSKPLSEEEKGTFVECMMLEHGDDRYVKAAETLERSMEEIFAFAQDLQEAMDRKHEQGQLNRPQDEWTYDIWVVPQ
ncbi:hypothetical protein ONS95_005432 [Cadophora gregata]|uniref:uncharacterized protein n=1 Tax=Cadophora gregata TaxID=51156 RepID=UPI0026DD3D0F|nr:uncharacterized protein ONS95_005432 [Cadophora gregata]KAK0103407.1 hypothetical protein ONS95_005432 [Cadophora gregata]KAK0107596.1 hypothetical protein ONS96_003402 [Cadophora gregata f. sp. sojae]